MQTLLTIGDFSRMTYLSVKALRHYHETGLLEPADVDPVTGYRLYDAGQVRTAQVIRRFRDLGMPLDQVRAVLEAPDAATRNRVVVAHLQRMEAELERTQATVSSLRALLQRDAAPIAVEYRSVAATPSLAVVDTLALSDFKRWLPEVLAELDAALHAARVEATGPAGALFADELFEQGRGEAVAFVPVGHAQSGAGRVQPREIPAAELAVAVHEGSFVDVDQTYAALGTLVAERAIGVEGPIRERYLIAARDTDDERRYRTEVCWPIFDTGGAR
jgi:DNA-binding transcriptional MerR regulator